MSENGWFPTSTKMPIPEAKTQPPIKPRLVILHSQAGVGSLFSYWLNGSNLESHFWCALGGASEQYVPCDVRADANYLANDFAISIESENHLENVRRGDWAGDPWTAQQVEEMASICAEAHRRYGIPLDRAKTWDGAGIGYHIQFGSPGKWTPVNKACPGATRIDQVDDVIARANELVHFKPRQPVGITPDSSETAIAFLQVVLVMKLGQHIPVTGVYDKATGQAVRNVKAFFNQHKIGDHRFDLSVERGWKAGPEFLQTTSDWVNFLESR